MTFPVLGGNGAVASYQIDNSLRFNDNDSAYLNRTPASASNRTTWTWSAWIKRSAISTGNYQTMWNAGSSSADDIRLTITNNDQIIFGTDATTFFLTSQRLRDVSAWYHIVFAFDTTQGTASDRAKLYINGSLVTDFSTDNRSSLSGSYAYNNTVGHALGRQAIGGSAYYDGYMAEINFIDGQQLSPTDFGEFDEDSGVWKPIQYTGSYGTNGFYLDFENSGSLGADQSGNGNNFTPTNLASTDQTTDTPTNNWSTLNPLILGGSITTSEGNTKISKSTTAFKTFYGTVPIPTSGKWYWELVETTSSSGDILVGICVVDGTLSTNVDTYPTNNLTSYCYYSGGGNFNYGPGNVNVGFGATWGQNDVIGLLFDADAGTLTFYKNGVSQGTPYTGLTAQYIPVFGTYLNGTTLSVNFGNPSFTVSSGNSDSNNYGNFEYSPSGGLALCTQNLATALSPTIDDGSAYFQSTPYTGNGSDGYAVTNSGYSDLQPDFVWIKKRSGSAQHVLTDSSRGVTKQLFSSLTDAEQTATEFLTSFDSDGFTTNNNSNPSDTGDTNIASGATYVAWQWKANGGTTSSNTDGSITSTVQANTTAGFSIVTYTGTGSAGTIGHSLGKVPNMIIVKRRSVADNWRVYHSANTSAPETDCLLLNSTSATIDDNTIWNDTAPTSTVFSIGADSSVTGSGSTFVAYCFAEIEGYSKFGSYTGNGNADGTFVYTGFRPSFVIVKDATVSASWLIHDATRSPYNTVDNELLADQSGAEYNTSSSYSFNRFDFLSNGFKNRGTNNGNNTSGDTYIYMAFAENPFVSSSGVPVVAR